MTPHISGTSLDAQIRYATGAHDIVKRYLAGEPQEQVNLIVENGEVSPKPTFFLLCDNGMWADSGSTLPKHMARGRRRRMRRSKGTIYR